MKTLQKCSVAGLRVPKTIFIRESLNIDFIISKIGLPFIIKTPNGSQGKGVAVIDTKRSGISIIEALLKTNKSLILQEFIGTGEDIRAIVTGNNDMHLKNFSMTESKSGWSLAPAYDLLNVALILPEDKEETALTISGKKKNLTGKSFINFGKILGLTEKQISGVFSRFLRNKSKAVDLINRSFLSNSFKYKYSEILENRYARIERI